MSVISEFNFNNKEEIFKFDHVAKQSNGSVLFQSGNNVILASVVGDLKNKMSEDFVPLTVQYIEKAYANSKMPSGFIKRETKPSDFEVLTARLIDRSIRPLFGSDFRYQTVITVMVMSCDDDADLQILALKAANAALFVSDLPIKKEISSGIRIGMIDDEIVYNATATQMKSSKLDLFLSGTKEELLMLEMGVKSNFDVVNDDADSFAKVHNTNEIDEDTLSKIIEDGFDDLKKTNISYENSFINIARTAVKDEIVVNKKDELTDFIKSNYSPKVEELLQNNSQEHKEELVEQISKEDICTNNEFSNKDISNSIQNVVAMIAKTMVLEKSIRADKRGLEDIRNISIESNLLPYAHSSCLFTRGQTQALAIGTIAEYRDGQTYELLNSKKSLTENFMLHYNFPSFSVGEAKTSFGTTRRELGHGNLAKKALEPTINTSEFTDTFRVVSEILESNGSSSMATVCASSIALKGANIPTSNLVAGVAMGMIKDENSYAILSDITEFEDHFGDLDFKIAGTKNGITAMQMDVDSSGIAKIQTIKEVLMQAKRARAVILEKMEHNVQNMTYSSVLPMSVKFNVDPSSIFAIIGKAGSVIRGIIEQFDVAIDLDKDNGVVKISASDKDKMQGAVEHIKDISDTISKQNIKKNLDFSVIYEKDEKVTGVVGNTVDFGVFIKLDKGGEGLLHVSKIPQEKANNLNDNFVKDAKIEVTILNAYKDKIELKMED